MLLYHNFLYCGEGGFLSFSNPQSPESQHKLYLWCVNIMITQINCAINQLNEQVIQLGAEFSTHHHFLSPRREERVESHEGPISWT